MKTVKDLMSLKGRVAVITGGAGHIGSVMAEALAECGAKTVLVDINEKGCQEKAKRIQKKYSVKTLSLTVDLADAAQTKNIPHKVLDRLKRIDILINCASVTGRTPLEGWQVPFEQQSLASWRKALEVSLTSIFTLIQACAGALKSSGHGSLINISSIYGMVGPDMSIYKGTRILGHPAAYDAAKGGLLQLTRYLATTLAPQVRGNAISIGGVLRGHTNPFLSQYCKKTPLKRMASEQDLKGAAVYLASDLSEYVTGHNLVVDGGWTAW